MIVEEDIELVLDARHVIAQRKVIAALLDTAGRSLWRGRNGHARTARPLELPGPETSASVAAPSAGLVRDYARHLGGATDGYRRPVTVPAHLFPQWTLPVAARALRPLPYALTRILNAGCRVEINADVPVSAPLTVRARLLDVADDGRRALLHQRVVTDAPSAPNAVVADLYAVAPSPARRDRTIDKHAKASQGGGAAPAPPREDTRVPAGAREIARFHWGHRAGLAYAFLTGDFNPVHWVRGYARAAGFATPILHGFAMMARVWEGLGRALFAGAADRIRVLDVKFKRPLALGKGVDVGLYLDESAVDPRTFYLADAPGVRAYLVGSFEARDAEPRPQGERHA